MLNIFGWVVLTNSGLIFLFYNVDIVDTYIYAMREICVNIKYINGFLFRDSKINFCLDFILLIKSFSQQCYVLLVTRLVIMFNNLEFLGTFQKDYFHVLGTLIWRIGYHIFNYVPGEKSFQKLFNQMFV